MAKRTKPRPPSIQTKQDLEYLVNNYIEIFKEADEHLRPQGHSVVKGKAWDKRRALEMAYLFMNSAVTLYDDDPNGALEFYYTARGIAMSQGEMPKESLLPEPTVLYTPKKPS